MDERMQIDIGSPAPNFRLGAATGNEIDLDMYRGKENVLLFFVREYN
ncbi:MAG: hypothetical protein M1281_03795 [Chloroflexi bacterium]|nr:hypothetical protein [Chloroflexota bacterium]